MQSYASYASYAEALDKGGGCMTARGDGWDVQVCEVCDGGTLHWVRWQNAHGEQHDFCDNECDSSQQEQRRHRCE